MKASGEVRVGFIGSGFARRVQLPGLQFVPGARATAVASGHRSNAEAVAREFGLRAYNDGEALARASDVDLVVVSSTPDSHARYAIAALEAGKHVLCEKPMAIDAFEAAKMVAATEQHPDSVAWVDHELRYEPNRRRARELIRSRAIGDLQHTTGEVVSGHRPHNATLVVPFVDECLSQTGDVGDLAPAPEAAQIDEV